MGDVRPDSIDRAEATSRAKRAWSLMDENEKTAVRIGMVPFWVTQENMGGKAADERIDTCWHKLQGDEHRQVSLALMAIASEDGGMIA